MNKLERSLLILAAAGGLTLAAAGPAMASGGPAGGGGTAGGGGAGGGGAAAGGGGGAAKGGAKDVVAPPCATVPAASAPVGYYSVWAAVWNTVTVKSCSASTETVNVDVSETNAATGLVDYDQVVPMLLTANQNSSMVLDNDFAPFDTTYTMTVKVSDTAGNVLATQSVVATTPPPK